MAVAALLAGAGAVYFTKQNLLDTANLNDAIGLIQNDTRAFWCDRAGVATPIQDATGGYLCPVRMEKYQSGKEKAGE